MPDLLQCAEISLNVPGFMREMTNQFLLVCCGVGMKINGPVRIDEAKDFINLNEIVYQIKLFTANVLILLFHLRFLSAFTKGLLHIFPFVPRSIIRILGSAHFCVKSSIVPTRDNYG